MPLVAEVEEQWEAVAPVEKVHEEGVADAWMDRLAQEDMEEKGPDDAVVREDVLGVKDRRSRGWLSL